MSTAATLETGGPQLHDVDVTSELLCISPQMVRKLETRGELRAVRIGRRLLFSRDEVARYIRALEAAARPRTVVGVGAGP
jgi:excisionase family DNA binding protein